MRISLRRLDRSPGATTVASEPRKGFVLVEVIVAMMILAIPFALGSTRAGGVGVRIVMGILIGLAIGRLGFLSSLPFRPCPPSGGGNYERLLGFHRRHQRGDGL